jgi:tetratricopeptide (TPR) repeat protein
VQLFLNNRLGKPMLALFLVVFTSLALALPSPKDIESAVTAGNFSQAESMLREVIQEKPQSAKAHYELGQVLARQARYADAQQSLAKAKSLDPALKFATSPEKFNDTFDKIARKAKEVSGQQLSSGLSDNRRPVAAAAAPAAPEPAFPLYYIWIGIAGLVILALVMRRKQTPVAAMPMQSSNGYAPSPAMGPQGAPGYGQAYPQQPMGGMGGGMGSGIGGAVVGGLAGVAAGYALSKALEGDHHNNAANAAQSAGNNNGYVPFDTPSQPDLGSFDSGSGSGWDDGGSADSGDDSW